MASFSSGLWGAMGFSDQAKYLEICMPGAEFLIYMPSVMFNYSTFLEQLQVKP